MSLVEALGKEKYKFDYFIEDFRRYWETLEDFLNDVWLGKYKKEHRRRERDGPYFYP